MTVGISGQRLSAVSATQSRVSSRDNDRRHIRSSSIPLSTLTTFGLHFGDDSDATMSSAVTEDDVTVIEFALSPPVVDSDDSRSTDDRKLSQHFRLLDGHVEIATWSATEEEYGGCVVVSSTSSGQTWCWPRRQRRSNIDDATRTVPRRRNLSSPVVPDDDDDDTLLVAAAFLLHLVVFNYRLLRA